MIPPSARRLTLFLDARDKVAAMITANLVNLDRIHSKKQIGTLEVNAVAARKQYSTEPSLLSE